MQSTIRLTEELTKRLNAKSIETGINPEILANDLLDKILSQEEEEDMVCLADSFKGLIDIIDCPYETNAVEVRDMVRERKL